MTEAEKGKIHTAMAPLANSVDTPYDKLEEAVDKAYGILAELIDDND
jgi:hypothetical protein